MSAAFTPAVRIVAFAALAAFAAAHWASLVVDPPAGRIGLSVAAVVVLAGVLELARRLPVGRVAVAAIAATASVAATGLAVVAVGVPLELLWPAGWGDLGDRLDLGLTGLAGDIAYPYDGGNEWSRLAILAVAPIVLGIAAAVAFWPAPEGLGHARAIAGLVLAVGLYVTAVAANPPPDPVLRGALLLALIAAWIWLPVVRRREGVVAAALVMVAGAAAVPAAAQLGSDDPWLDYRSWVLRTPDGATFSWEHSYGPLDWERDGTRMLTVESEEAHYWRTTVLDQFDGRRWTRAGESSQGSQAVDSGEPIDPGAVEPAPMDPQWLRRVAITVGELESEIVVAPGTPRRIDGLGVLTAPDGTTTVRDEPLESGDTYEVTAYVPDPGADAMRTAPESYPASLVRHTQLDLPPRSEDGEGLAPAELITVPLRGEPRDPEVEAALAGSAYGRVRGLVRELVADEPTAYDAVRAIQDHLRDGYDYSELVPSRELPLDAFLFRDRRGYCQQFSGAMTLMLRMAGIPSRVAGGFAPGSREEGGGPFRVEDFDAHSWVEVYFDGIGWVAFDPTPSSAPASSQQISGFPVASSAPRGGSDDAEPAPAEGPEEEQAPAVGAPGGGGGGSAGIGALLAIAGAAILGVSGLGWALVAARAARHRRLPPDAAADAQLAELARAVDRLGVGADPGTTLLALERRLRGTRRHAVASYAARLRALRYSSSPGSPPTLAERRGVRRELAAGGGAAGVLRALLAIPPGGPRPRVSGGA